MEDDFDFSDLANVRPYGQPEACPCRTTNRTVSTVVAPVPAEAATELDAEETDVAVGPVRILKLKWKPLGVPGKSVDRSKVDHKLVCERARAGKAVKRAQAELSEINDGVGKIMEASGRDVTSSSLDKRFGLKKALARQLSRRCGVLFKLNKKHGGKGHKLHASTELAIGFDRAVRQSDIARSHGVDEKTVGSTWCVVAQSHKVATLKTLSMVGGIQAEES